MTTMYARSDLSTWDNSTVGGWSATSGGASNGLVPTSGDPVIFDANSGTSRTITVGGGATCGGITTVGANAMTFSSNGVDIYGSIDLTGMVGFSVGIGARGTGTTIKMAGATAGYLTIYDSNTLSSDVSLTAALNVSGSATLTLGGYNVTAASFIMGPGTAVLMGAGVMTLTGAGTPLDCWAGVSITPSTSIMRFTNAAGTAKVFTGAGNTFGAVEFLMAGSLELTGANTFGSMTLGPGLTLILPHTNTTTVANLIANGTGGTVTLQSSSAGTPATLAKSGGGTVYVDGCSIKDSTASPGSTFFARSSVSVSGNSGWTFVPGNRAFLTFF